MSVLTATMASAIAFLIAYVMQFPLGIAMAAALAVFPAVLVLTQSGTSAVTQSSTNNVSSLLDEEEEKARKKADKKKKKEAEARAKAEAKANEAAKEAEAAKAAKSAAKAAKPAPQAAKPAPQAAKPTGKQAKVVVPESDSDDDDDEDRKGMTKTALKKAKKEAAKKREEERLQAEAAIANKKAARAAKKAGGAPAAVESAAPAAQTNGVKARPVEDNDGWETVNERSSRQASSIKKANQASAKAAEQAAASAGSSDAAEYREELFVAPDQRGILIGEKGSMLQQLQTATGAKINMPKKTDPATAQVVISGTPDAVRACRGAIESLIRYKYSSITHPGWMHDDMHVDEKHFAIIIGKKGQHLQAIQDHTGTFIKLPEKDSVSSRVVIAGLKDGIRLAKAAIKELVAEEHSSITHPNHVKRVVEFPTDKLSFLIGNKGQTIKSIQGNNNCKINIKQSTSPVSEVTIWAEEDRIEHAVKEVNRLLIPQEIVREEPEEEYVNGTWSEPLSTEDSKWD